MELVAKNKTLIGQIAKARLDFIVGDFIFEKSVGIKFGKLKTAEILARVG